MSQAESPTAGRYFLLFTIPTMATAEREKPLRPREICLDKTETNRSLQCFDSVYIDIYQPRLAALAPHRLTEQNPCQAVESLFFHHNPLEYRPGRRSRASSILPPPPYVARNRRSRGIGRRRHSRATDWHLFAGALSVHNLKRQLIQPEKTTP